MPVYQKKKRVIDKNGNKKEIVVKTADGRSWIFRTYYTDMYGNRKQKKSEAYLTQREAKEAERDFLTTIQYQSEYTNVIQKNISFEILYLEWFTFKKKSIKSTSAYRLRKTLDKNIFTFFKSYKLNAIKMNIINQWLEFLNNSGNSLECQNKIICYLKEILNYAKLYYDFDEKIISRIQTYRIETSARKERSSEWNFWTYEEFEKFINAVDDDFYYLIFNFLYFTGLRIGEMIALTWKQVDLEKRIIKVRNNFTNKIEEQPYAILDPKTKNSIRDVDLDDKLFNLLEKHYTNEQKLYGFNDEMFVFGNIKYVSPTTFSNHLKKYIKLASVKRITPHGFRHSHVSLLIHLGCDCRDVAARIGDTVEMVEKTYYHMFPQKKSSTINALNNFKNTKK